MSIPNDIVLYHYSFSPYARRIVWYLQLRGIKYANCYQPAVMPRPDLEALNVAYRRIPLMSMGRDMYCDTRIILRKLEERFPAGKLGTSDPEHRALERLIERWTVDAGIFVRAAQLIPLNLPNMNDPVWLKDRQEFSGALRSKETMAKVRGEALAHIRDAFELFETTLLADGRDWIFKTDKPSLGDIEAVWPFHWLVDLKQALDPNYISDTQFPKTFAWIKRFDATVKQAKASQPKAPSVKGEEVAKYMASAKFYEPVGEVDANDPLGLKAGEAVTTWPIETGFTRRDTGKLLSLTPGEIVIAKNTKAGEEIHIHMPRWGFRCVKASAAEASKI